MHNILLILPTNLYKTHTVSFNYVYIVEHPVYFTDYKYHKQKLILHRASMKYYEKYIKNKFNVPVKYFNISNFNTLFNNIPKDTNLIYYDPVDHDVLDSITKMAKKHNLHLTRLDTKTFITPFNVLKEYNEKNNKLIQFNFYKFQRKRLNILLTNTNKPLGGKWSYDIEDRKPFPVNFKFDYKPTSSKNEFVLSAKKYVNKHFSKNPGSDDAWMPVTHKEADKMLTNFIKTKLLNFGPYQDAVNNKIFSGYHSVLSPIINIGLLDPLTIIKKVLDNTNVKNKKQLISVEAYIRQLIGWREYCRLVYMFRHKELEGNYFNNKNRLPNDWFKLQDNYTGFTIVDNMIKKTWMFAYLHHIERLMYVGNYMLLVGILPKDVYEWYQTMFLDSYAVFMYPNVYGMSQHSSGPVMMTKPYFSSAAYIHKMSDYKVRTNTYDKLLGTHEWYNVWNALYYSFVSKNAKKLKKNYGTANQVSNWNAKSTSEQKELLALAIKYKQEYNLKSK